MNTLIEEVATIKEFQTMENIKAIVTIYSVYDRSFVN